MKVTTLTILFLVLLRFADAQVPYIVWQRSLGGSEEDNGQSILRTTDNQIAILGYTGSTISSPDIHNQHSTGIGLPDMWFLKFLNDGSEIYNNCYGGGVAEVGFSLIQKDDGRFALLGLANSNDQYVTGVHGAIGSFGRNDIWLVQLDSANDVEWQHSYGTTEMDEGRSLQLTKENGYFLMGKIEGFDGDVTNFHGAYDLWVVKTDSLGNLIWQVALGGSSYEYPGTSMATQDGGLLVGCVRSSSDGNVTCTNQQKELWIVKLDSLGNILWDRCYGGSGSDWVSCFLPASNNGFYAGGFSSSVDGDISSPLGSNDGWVFKADSSGNIIWDKSLGGTDWDEISSMCFTSDYSIVCSGGSRSTNMNFHGGFCDAFVVKLDTSGNLIWQQCYGGSGDDWSNAIVEASDSSLFFVGYSTSDDGDLTLNRGVEDMWVVKLASPNDVFVNEINNNFSDLSVTSDFINLTLGFNSLNSEVFELNIFDLTGRLIFAKNIISAPGKNEVILDINSITNGLYILRLSSERKRVCRKVVF